MLIKRKHDLRGKISHETHLFCLNSLKIQICQGLFHCKNVPIFVATFSGVLAHQGVFSEENGIYGHQQLYQSTLRSSSSLGLPIPRNILLRDIIVSKQYSSRSHAIWEVYSAVSPFTVCIFIASGTSLVHD